MLAASRRLFEPLLVENSSHVCIVVVVQEAVHFGYHGRILLVAFAVAQRQRQHQCVFDMPPRKRPSSWTCSPFRIVTSSMRRRTIRLRSRSAVPGSFDSCGKFVARASTCCRCTLLTFS